MQVVTDRVAGKVKAQTEWREQSAETWRLTERIGEIREEIQTARKAKDSGELASGDFFPYHLTGCY